MDIQLSKSEKQILQYLPFFKVLSVGGMVISGLFFLFEVYLRFFKNITAREEMLFTGFIGLTIVMYVSASFMHQFLRLIEKLNVQRQANDVKAV